MADLIPDEMCPASQADHGCHCDCWYEDEGCHWCGTTEPNLVVIELPDEQRDPGEVL